MNEQRTADSTLPTNWITLAEFARKHGFGSRSRLVRLTLAALEAKKVEPLATLKNGRRTLFRERDLNALLA